jgi:ABC-2 type transport system ATP-binding protein
MNFFEQDEPSINRSNLQTKSNEIQKAVEEPSVLKVVRMENVSSLEHFSYEDGSTDQVLKDISIIIHAGQVWGITGSQLFDIKLLLEIMANVKPYSNGKCVLNERGMMRKKRIILPHVFYIGDGQMLFNNMNMLEYLMFCTDKLNEDPIDRQELFIDLIVEMGLGFLCLVPINYLSKAQKAVITLVTAACSSNSKLIVFNLPEIEFDDVLQIAISRIAKYIKLQDRTLVIGTKNPHLIQHCCDHTAFLLNGTLKFKGSINDLYEDYNKKIFIIKIAHPQNAINLISSKLPQFQYEIEEDKIIMYDHNNCTIEHSELYEIISNLYLKSEIIEQSKKSVKNAYKEVIKQNDIQR